MVRQDVLKQLTSLGDSAMLQIKKEGLGSANNRLLEISINATGLFRKVSPDMRYGDDSLKMNDWVLLREFSLAHELCREILPTARQWAGTRKKTHFDVEVRLNYIRGKVSARRRQEVKPFRVLLGMQEELMKNGYSVDPELSVFATITPYTTKDGKVRTTVETFVLLLKVLSCNATTKEVKSDVDATT